jgi:hypothetical protein
MRRWLLMSDRGSGRLAYLPAVGEFVNSSGKEVPLAEQWNGTEWSLQEPPSPAEHESRLQGVSCTSSAACTAVGYSHNSTGNDASLAEKWNGTEWSSQQPPSPKESKRSVLYSLSCTMPSACIAVGDFERSSGEELLLAEKWNGTAWSLQEPPSPTEAKRSLLYSVSCTAATECTAAGDFETSVTYSLPLAERYQ